MGVAILLGIRRQRTRHPRYQRRHHILSLLQINSGTRFGPVELRGTGASTCTADLYIVSQTIAEQEGLRHPLTATSTVPITDPRPTHNNHSKGA